MNIGRLKVAAALIMTAPFIPMLFQGEEWGASSPFLYFTDHQDAELGRAVTEGRRREFAAFSGHREDVPDPQARETFEASKLVWTERDSEPHRELLEWHRRLIGLRRKVPALSDGRLDRVSVRFDETARWLVMRRGPVAVGCNLGGAAQRVPGGIGRDAQILLASEKQIRLVDDCLDLPPNAVAVIGAVPAAL
jgi:maltooligosyltrehalose trehalohydrolase